MSVYSSPSVCVAVGIYTTTSVNQYQPRKRESESDNTYHDRSSDHNIRV